MVPLDQAPPEIDPPNVGDDWPVWRAIEGGFGTLTEIERHWWVEHVLDANEAYDVFVAANPNRRGRRS
jgi:hypothetical protein